MAIPKILKALGRPNQSSGTESPGRLAYRLPAALRGKYPHITAGAAPEDAKRKLTDDQILAMAVAMTFK